MTDIEDYAKINLNSEKIKLFLKELIKSNNIEDTIIKLRKKYKIHPNKRELLRTYNLFFKNEKNEKLSNYLIKKSIRSKSGVLVCTLVLKPSKFSCTHKCAYCPTETDLYGIPTQPKSYLSTEPAMMRALQHNFNIAEQLWDRINSYIITGNIDNTCNYSHKLEIIFSGGTWDIYPFEYRLECIHKLFWAANTFNNHRDIFNLEKEIICNETALFRIIGITIETRPDYINNRAIKYYRLWGITRIQLGVQHYNDSILKYINRECYLIHTIKAIKLLKQCGFKIVCHLMPDLPKSTPELDRLMFQQSIENPDLQFDDVKIYPTAICKSKSDELIVSSQIEEWYNLNIYKPYSETNIQELINILIYYKTNIQPWVRIQRLVRDIPESSILAGYGKKSNLRQIIKNIMNKNNQTCNCIRCREVEHCNIIYNNFIVVVRKYFASDGIEFFISIEDNKYDLIFILKYYIILLFTWTKIYHLGNNNSALIGFCRLRLDKNAGNNFIHEIEGCALIRELHIYGYSTSINNNDDNNNYQHKGYGKLLVKIAEHISIVNNYKKIAIISGIGSREYYKNKCNYILDGTYMVKNLNNKYYFYIIMKIFIIIIWIIISMYLIY
jgi:ELP3 family radical SAM enzyme/protein acetyltransferase